MTCPVCEDRGYILTDEEVTPCPECSGEDLSLEEKELSTAEEINAGSFLVYGNHLRS